MTVRWTPSERTAAKTAAVRSASLGKKNREISVELGVSVGTVENLLREAGFRRRHVCPPNSSRELRLEAGSGPKDPETGCILWVKATNGVYGNMPEYVSPGKSRQQYAHRVALELKLGRSLQPGEVARHSCDTPLCVNPDHLSVGSAQDNSNDMVSRRRDCGATPSLRSRKAEATRLLAETTMLQREIAAVTGLSLVTVGRLKRGVTRV